MSMALSLGRRGLGQTWPNPSVGCVLVKDGLVIGRGVTAKGGRPHAEDLALRQAGDRAKGSTLYVTLEPCSHSRKNGSCTQAIIKAGVGRVVAAIRDVDPRVNGQGFAKLTASGIKVNVGLMASEAARDHAGFISRVRNECPYISLKLAQSFDGRTAISSGESKWITNQASRRLVHLLRSRSDAVMVGGGTARKDNPALTVRGIGVKHDTVRIVISGPLDIPKTSQFLSTAKENPLWLCHSKAASLDRKKYWEDRGAQLFLCESNEGFIDLKDVFRKLALKGLTRVFCEGGSTLASSLIKLDLVDELIGFNAGILIGSEGSPSIGELGIKKLADAPKFNLYSSGQVGSDILNIWLRENQNDDFLLDF